MVDGRAKIVGELRASEARARMVRVAKTILKDADESEDAAHDAIVQALTAADCYRSDARVSTWLHRIVVNAALMRRRKAQRSEKHVAASSAEGDVLPWLGGIDQRPPAPALLEESERRAWLIGAVARLPEAYRSVIERHVFAGESPEEVARRLGLTPSAVRTRIGRARIQLGTLLEAWRNDEPMRHAA